MLYRIVIANFAEQDEAVSFLTDMFYLFENNRQRDRLKYP